MVGRDALPRCIWSQPVTREAALSPRFFYESFTDRDDLIRAVYDDAIAGMKAATDEALTGQTDLEGSLRAMFAAVAALVENDPRVGRIVFREPLTDDILQNHATAAVPEFFMPHLTALTPAASKPAASAPATDLQITALAGALISLFIGYAEGSLQSDRESFVDYCTKVALSLLA